MSLYSVKWIPVGKPCSVARFVGPDFESSMKKVFGDPPWYLRQENLAELVALKQEAAADMNDFLNPFVDLLEALSQYDSVKVWVQLQS